MEEFEASERMVKACNGILVLPITKFSKKLDESIKERIFQDEQFLSNFYCNYFFSTIPTRTGHPNRPSPINSYLWYTKRCHAIFFCWWCGNFHRKMSNKGCFEIDSNIPDFQYWFHSRMQAYFFVNINCYFKRWDAKGLTSLLNIRKQCSTLLAGTIRSISTCNNW